MLCVCKYMWLLCVFFYEHKIGINRKNKNQSAKVHNNFFLSFRSLFLVIYPWWTQSLRKYYCPPKSLHFNQFDVCLYRWAILFNTVFVCQPDTMNWIQSAKKKWNLKNKIHQWFENDKFHNVVNYYSINA